MSFATLALSYVLTTIVFLAIDLLWLGVIAQGIYKKSLGHYLAAKVKWAAAIIFYLIFIVGIFIFVILPAVEIHSLFRATILGGLFGFFTYSTYELTNLAMMKDWPLSIVVIDIAWGVFLTSAVSTAGYLITQWLM